MYPNAPLLDNINAVTAHRNSARPVEITTLKVNGGYSVAAIRLNPLEMIVRATPLQYSVSDINAMLGVLHKHSAENVAKSLGIS